MSDDQSFLNLIADEPDNLTVRLVYCDWLEERNDPRQHYLRAWCHLATYPAEEWIGYPDLRIELAKMAAPLRSDWLAAVDCRRFYLDLNAAARVAERFLLENYPRSAGYKVDPKKAEARPAGWYSLT